MSDRNGRLERLVADALTLGDFERSEFLREICDGDEELLHALEALLELAKSNALPPRKVADEPKTPDQRRGEEIDANGWQSSEALPAWAYAVVFAAAVRVIVALVLYFSAPLPIVSRAARSPAILPPWWIYAAVSITFMALGLGLVFAHRRDSRAAWLGGILTLTAVPFATPLLNAASPGSWLGNLRPDAFSAAFLWQFLVRFPTQLTSRRASVFVRASGVAAAVIGGWCAAASLALLWLPVDDRWPWLASFAVNGRLYWTVTLGVTAPTFPVLIWRAATAHGAARRRIKVFALGLLAGFVPFTLEVLIEEVIPAYKAWAYGPTIAPWIGTAIFSALAIVPFVTTYSVLFDRVVDVRVVLRAAAQYVLARYTILTVTLVPFAALAIFLHEHRTEAIVSLVTGLRPLLLGTVIAIGLVSFRLRSRWFELLDRRYFRESYNAHEILERVMGELQGTSADQLVQGMRREIERALHAETHVFLADETGAALRHIDGQLPPIALQSKIADLALADSRPMDIDLDAPQSLLSRLPEEEQHWLRSGNFCLLVALRRASGGLEGLLAISPKRSGLPFSDDDRRLLSSIAAAATLAFDSLRLRTTPITPIERSARECLDCGRVTSLEVLSCECGGDLAVANVPQVLRGVFRLKQRIGAGGMGVVYRAVDLTLNREVAIKALPRATPELVALLRREARAMAAVTHPNLAVIHGVETWRGMPFLVQEYLSGGTLAQRLTAARPTIREALDLGVTLATVLQHLHANRVIHCDIKPSNIGFTQQGVVKLLDFGLARIMRDARVSTRTTALNDESVSASADPSAYSNRGWFGTPYYMSPEAARGDPPAPSLDLWALVVVLYEAMAGCRPFEGPNVGAILARIRTGPATDIREVRRDIPEEIAAFFDSALSSDIARRSPDAGALAITLVRLRNG